MKTRNKIFVLLALPAMALSMAACSNDKEEPVVDTVQSEIVVEDNLEQSGGEEIEQSGQVLDLEELQIGVLDLKEETKAYEDASESSEQVGLLGAGVYPVAEVDGDWKQVIVSADGKDFFVWTNADEEISTLDLDEVTVEDE